MPTFRIKEAAALLGVSDDTMRRRVEAGRIAPASDGSGRLAVDGASLARFAQERAVAAAHPPEAGPGGQSLAMAVYTAIQARTSPLFNAGRPRLP